MRIPVIIILIVVFASCGQNDPKDNIKLTEFEKAEYLKTVKDFTISYLPDSIPNTGISSFSNIPDSIKQAINVVGQINKIEQEKYLTLLFTKLYRSHLQCCNQSYVLRNCFVIT